MESKTFVLRDLEGLHARNAAKVVMAVQGGGDVKVTVRCGGVEADGENILELMSLNARYGVRGQREREILEEVEKAVNNSMI